MSNARGWIHRGAALSRLSNAGHGGSYGQGSPGYFQSTGNNQANHGSDSNPSQHVSPEDYTGEFITLTGASGKQYPHCWNRSQNIT